MDNNQPAGTAIPFTTPEPKPTPGSASNTPWNVDPGSFAPNTNALDPTSAPSHHGDLAREKSAAVMAALKRGDEAEANRIMGKNNNTQGQLVPPGPMKWIKRKLTGGRSKHGEAGQGKGVGWEKEGADSLASSVQQQNVVVGDKKEDGVVR